MCYSNSYLIRMKITELLGFDHIFTTRYQILFSMIALAKTKYFKAKIRLSSHLVA